MSPGVRAAGDDGRPAAVAFLDDLEKHLAGAGVERLKSPIIEYQPDLAAEHLLDRRGDVRLPPPVTWPRSASSALIWR